MQFPQGEPPMRLITLAACAAGAAAIAGTAMAAPVTDVGYIQAARCKGVAEGAGKSTPALDAFLKKQSYVRGDAALQRAKDVEEAGRHMARDSNDQAQAELNGVCAAWLSNPETAGSGAAR